MSVCLRRRVEVVKREEGEVLDVREFRVRVASKFVEPLTHDRISETLT